MTNEIIEAGARAIYRSVNRGHADTKGWDEVKPNWQRSYRRDATAAYNAMRALIVTETLLQAADEFLPTVAASILIESPQAIYDATVNRGRDWLRLEAILKGDNS